MTTTNTYGAILDGTVTGYNLDDCLKQAKGEAGPGCSAKPERWSSTTPPQPSPSLREREGVGRFLEAP